MTALAASRTDITELSESKFNTYPVAASTTIYLGAMVVLNYLGQAIPAASLLQGHLRVVGVSQGRLQPGANSPVIADDATAVTAGDYDVQVQTGKFAFYNGSASNGGASTDTITSADKGGWAYAIDDQTVSRESLDGNRPCVGRIVTIQDDGLVVVQITGERWSPAVVIQELKADADLSSLRNSQVRVDDASGAGRVDSATTDTTRTVGILINAPDAAGKKAQVITHGPAPCGVGGSGITAGDKVSATTAGKSIAAGAAKTFVGIAMEGGNSGDTKMIWVQPGVMPA